MLKSIGAPSDPEGFVALREHACRPDMHVIEGPMRALELKAVLELCDCYLSLHRSEGFGLTMAQAMAAGRPVIPTAWSANLEFMDDDVAHLIPADIVAIPREVPVYGGHGLWADPNVDLAAAALRRVYEDRRGAAELGARARLRMAQTRSLERTGRILTESVELESAAST